MRASAIVASVSAPVTAPAAVAVEALHDIEQAHAQLLAAIAACPDPGAALAIANAAKSHMQQLFEGTSAARLQIIAGIYAAERPSLAQLGRLIGVSKSRADQMVRVIRARGTAA